MAATRDPATGARALADDVWVFTSGAYALNSGVVLGRSGTGAPRRAVLVDPAYFPGEIERIDAFLVGLAAGVERVVLTHSDWDHIVGSCRWPDAPVVASSEYPARVRAEGDRIRASLVEFDRRLYVARESEVLIPEPSTLVGSPSDLIWGGPRTRLLPAGGHTPDGLMILLSERKVLFSGDHLSDREIPFVGDSVAAYRETLGHVRRMTRAGEVETLVPGHGEICASSEILERIDEDVDYLDRLEAWVRETLRTIRSTGGILDRCQEVVFRKGWDNPDVLAEHRSNVRRVALALGAEPDPA